MGKKPRKTGLPKVLEQEELAADERSAEPTMEEFVQGMFGQADKPQEGLPSMEWLKEQFQTKSAAIRYLVNQGFEVKTIAKHLGIRYQHARNVANTPMKRGPNEDWRKPLLTDTKIPDPKQFKPEDV